MKVSRSTIIKMVKGFVLCIMMMRVGYGQRSVLVTEADVDIQQVRYGNTILQYGTRSTPLRINYQGYLADDAGNPITNTVTMIFRVYDAVNGGNEQWSSGVQSIDVVEGIFCHILDNIPLDVFETGEARWLELTVEGEVLSPRTEVTSSAWAYASTCADSSEWSSFADSAAGAGRIGGQTLADLDTRYINDNEIAGGDLAGTYPNPSISGNVIDSMNIIDGSVSQTDLSFIPGSGSVSEVSQGTGIVCQPNPIVDTGTVAFNQNWGNGQYINEGQAAGGNLTGTYPNPNIANNSINTAMLQNDAVNVDKLAHNINATGIGFNAAQVDGYSASGSPTGGHLYPLTADARFDISGNYSSPMIRAYNTGNSGDYYAVHGLGTYGFGIVGRTLNENTNGAGSFLYPEGTSVHYVHVGMRMTSPEYNFKIFGIGQVSTYMETRDGDRILFAPECPEALFCDYGQGQLSGGHVRIELDPLFLDCIKSDDDHPIKVFVTLNNDCNGVYVKVNETGFDVHELLDGTSNASFTYQVVANRKDAPFERLPVVPDFITYKEELRPEE